MWVFDPDSGQLKEQEEAQAKDLSGTAVSSGSPATVGTAPAAASTPAPTSSGNFTDINKYLTLNQPQADALGQKVAGNIETHTGAANTAIDSGQKAFADALAASNPGMSKAEIDALAADPHKLADFVKDPTNVSRFTSTAVGNYTGPSKFSDVGNYADLVKTVSGASQAAEQVKTSGGRQELIKDVYQKPERAKTGMLSLDESLVKQSPGGMKPIEEKASEAAGVDKRLADIEASAAPAIAAQRDAVTGRAQDIQNEILGNEGAYGKLRQDIAARTKAAQETSEGGAADVRHYTDLDWLKGQGIITGTPVAKNSTYERFGLDPSKVAISDAALKDMGITKDQYLDLLTKQIAARNAAGTWSHYGSGGTTMDFPDNPGVYIGPENAPLADWRKFVNFDEPTAVTSANVATKEDYETANALKQLFGDRVDFSYLNTPEQAGTAKANPVHFDYQQLLDYLNKEQGILDYLNKAPKGPMGNWGA